MEKIRTRASNEVLYVAMANSSSSSEDEYDNPFSSLSPPTKRPVRSKKLPRKLRDLMTDDQMTLEELEQDQSSKSSYSIHLYIE